MKRRRARVVRVTGQRAPCIVPGLSVGKERRPGLPRSVCPPCFMHSVLCDDKRQRGGRNAGPRGPGEELDWRAGGGEREGGGGGVCGGGREEGSWGAARINASSPLCTPRRRRLVGMRVCVRTPPPVCPVSTGAYCYTHTHLRCYNSSSGWYIPRPCDP